MGKWTYFTDREVIGLENELVAMLDNARHKAGVPFIIVSGRRSIDHNKSVGGVDDSAHLTGQAADIRTGDSYNHAVTLMSLIQVGFNRFGQYFEQDYENGSLRPLSIHVDIDPTKPKNMSWFKIILKKTKLSII